MKLTTSEESGTTPTGVPSAPVSTVLPPRAPSNQTTTIVLAVIFPILLVCICIGLCSYAKCYGSWAWRKENKKPRTEQNVEWIQLYVPKEILEKEAREAASGSEPSSPGSTDLEEGRGRIR